jgi:ABC-type dipeptide/oligopeptide/nickel transport system ATPase subunit
MKALQSNEVLLPGTGGELWKKLFEAARKFSEEAYIGCDFPHTADGALCPLCQQPIYNAKNRMKRFDDYIKKDSVQKGIEARENRDKAIEILREKNLSLMLEPSLMDELGSLDNNIVNMLRTLEKSIDEQRIYLINTLTSGQWLFAREDYHAETRLKLRKIIARQLCLGRQYDRSIKKCNKEGLLAEKLELLSRKELSFHLNEFLKNIEQLQLKHSLETCRDDLKPRPVTDKAKQLSGQIITESLKQILDHELNTLGMSHLKIKIDKKAERGQAKYWLVLDIPLSKFARKLRDILSEGEQMCIALAFFLAEIGIAGHKGAIILDDPISSLDHLNRKKVAKRMAEEAKKRQVIIFTHDIVFLHGLRSECDTLKIPREEYVIQTINDHCGCVSTDLPIDKIGYNERLDTLEKSASRMKKAGWPAVPNNDQRFDIMNQYSLLRSTIEQIIERFILNSTVLRLENYINVKQLAGVVGLEKSEADEIRRLFRRCSELIPAHDNPLPDDSLPPTPDELKKDIDDVKKLIETIRERRTKK